MAVAQPTDAIQVSFLDQPYAYDTAVLGQLSTALGSANSRRLLNRLLLEQQQQQQSKEQGKQQDSKQQVDRLLEDFKKQQGSDLRPLYDMARSASGPNNVIIVDNSPFARNQRRGGNGDEEIIVIPVYQPSVPSTRMTTPVVLVPSAVSAGPPPGTTVSTVPGNAAQVFVPVPAGQVSQVQVVTPIGQPAPPITFIPTKPVVPAPLPPGRQVQPGPYCIPRPTNGFPVLAIGDSITQGSVPSKNFNHPYTIELQKVLEPQLQMPVRAVDAGLGGGGVFMPGFSVPVTFGPWLDTYMSQGPWSVVVVMIGINDLLRGGKPADDIMNNLKPMIEKVVAANTPIILMPPFAAPGFVSEHDSKEAERKKLAQLFRSYAVQHASRTGGMGPQVWMLDLQSAPFDFYPMTPAERSKWLDDGLHLTEVAYDTIGQLVAQEIMRCVCSNAVTSN